MKEKELEKSLKALANKRRLMILRYIKKNHETSVSNISREIKLSFKATSRHLIILFSADIVEKEQRSSQVFYRLSDTRPLAARNIINLL